MGGSRGVTIGFEPAASHLYVRLPTPSDEAPRDAFAGLNVQVRQVDKSFVLEIGTECVGMFREFHRFAGLLTEDFEDPSQTAIGAFEKAIERWREFTARRELLTPEQQTGLYGELLLLDAAIRLMGPASINSWIGSDPRLPARHDFRMHAVDIEVKTTRSRERCHFVHGLEQLQPAPNHRLYILSIRTEPAGTGEGVSLADLVVRVRDQLKKDTNHSRTFELKLSTAGYLDADASFYSERLSLADSPRVIPVNEDCPRLTPGTLGKVLPSTIARRIEQVSYRIDLEGLGFEQGSTDYDKVFMGMRLSS